MRSLFVALPVLAMLIFVSGIAHASISINDCAVIDTPTTYLLTQDINLSSDVGYCFYQTVNGATLDCQGHTVNGNFLTDSFITSVHDFTVKNCHAKNFYGSFVAGEDNTGAHFFNNEFDGAPWCMGGYYDSALVIENNTFANIGSGCIPVTGSDALVRNNRFEATVLNPIIVSPFDPGYFSNNRVYNNYFGSPPEVLSDISFTMMDVSPRPGNGILLYDFIAGNYYNEDCDDLDCNGLCDNPKVFNDNVTDFFPLSSCFIQPVPTPSTPPQLLSEDKYCSGTQLATKSTFLICGNNTCVNKNIYSYANCQYGCNLKTIPNVCKGSPEDNSLWFFVIVMVILFAAGFMFMKLQKKY